MKKDPHAVKLGSKGGNANFRKNGSAGMRRAINIRWAKYRSKLAVVDSKVGSEPSSSS